MSTERYTQALEATVEGLRRSLREDVPECTYRSYCDWSLSDENPRRDAFLQAMGITQLTHLTLTLLDGMVEERHWPRLVDCSVVMNVYQVWEIISDNLAIGLARRAPADSTYIERRQLVLGFNRAMVERLNGRSEHARETLRPWQQSADRLSSFTQSLIAEKHAVLAEEYVRTHPGTSLAEIEHSIWPALVANIETCAALSTFTSQYQLGPHITGGLVKRYSAVTRLVEHQDMTPEQRGSVGADAILVMPTLAYYVAVLAEMLEPTPGLHEVVEDGTLPGALFDVALLVRMVNDLGGLVKLSEHERASLVKSLGTDIPDLDSQASQFGDVLSTAGQSNALLTRVLKDVSHGEYNLAVDGLAGLSSLTDALKTFDQRLEYYGRLYRETSLRLTARFKSMDRVVGKPTISALLGRFLQFHEMLYSNPYTKQAGEYAI